MNRVRRLLLIGLAAVTTLVGAGFGAIYTLSEAVIRRVDAEPMAALAVDRSPAAVARGKRLAAIWGCSGCHGADLAGSDYGWNEPGYIRRYSANLTQRLPDYSDPEIARAVRRGFDNRGHPLWDMPSHGFTAIDDRDMVDLIAFLRAHKPAGRTPPRPWFGWKARWDIVTGALEPIPALAAQARANPPIDLGAQFARGRYLTQTACAECHQSDLKGHAVPEGATPDLMIAASYDLEGFTRLMRTGRAADGKDRRLMSGVARARFSHFTDDEIAAIHAYLTARAERSP